MPRRPRRDRRPGRPDTPALLASVVLRIRHRHYRALHDAETVDTDHDGVPDAYQDDASDR